MGPSCRLCAGAPGRTSCEHSHMGNVQCWRTREYVVMKEWTSNMPIWEHTVGSVHCGLKEAPSCSTAMDVLTAVEPSEPPLDGCSMCIEVCLQQHNPFPPKPRNVDGSVHYGCGSALELGCTFRSLRLCSVRKSVNRFLPRYPLQHFWIANAARPTPLKRHLTRKPLAYFCMVRVAATSLGW
jgi:hypothetical protein